MDVQLITQELEAVAQAVTHAMDVLERILTLVSSNIHQHHHFILLYKISIFISLVLIFVKVAVSSGLLKMVLPPRSPSTPPLTIVTVSYIIHV